MPSQSTNEDYWGTYNNHQKIKHRLVKHYLDGWLPKLTLGGFEKVIYFDTHAGRGRHNSGEYGSPIVALTSMLNHSFLPRILRNSEVNLLFIEQDAENCVHLENELASHVLPSGMGVNILNGDAFNTLSTIVDSIGKKAFAPSFVFVDPFSFEIAGEVLQRLMRHPGVELFVNVIWRHLQLAIGHAVQGKQVWIEKLDKIFAGREWLSIVAASGTEAKLASCVEAFRKMTNARWATYMQMLGNNQSPVMALVHLTKHHQGRDLMKECMWKVCPTGDYCASRTDNGQTTFRFSQSPDLDSVEAWVVNQLSGGPARWSKLEEAIRDELWLCKHLNTVVRRMNRAGTIVGSRYDGKFARTNDPFLTLVR